MSQAIAISVIIIGFCIYTIPFWIVLTRLKSKESIWEGVYFILFPPFILWLILIISEPKGKTFSNIMIEPFIIGFFSALFFWLQMRIVNKSIKKSLIQPLTILFSIAIAFIVWLLFPALQE